VEKRRCLANKVDDDLILTPASLYRPFWRVMGVVPRLDAWDRRVPILTGGG
jgi:hypothetical protein